MSEENNRNYEDTEIRDEKQASLGMLVAAGVTLAISTFLPETGLTGNFSISWNLVLIAVIAGYFLMKRKWSIPKTILLSAILGLLIG